MKRQTFLLFLAPLALTALRAQTTTPDQSAGQPAQSAPATKTTQTAPAGCISTPVKKPLIHLPKKIQDAINKNADKIASKTGVEMDKNAPAQAVKDAQNKPCVPAPQSAPAQNPPKQ